ncbi:protein-tyrosine-phosphatase MKP1 [Amborella trichopoda]|uniref:protein-tyrosine-phosphatase MKP1 n=1 Tax=Amborella trichopoda TaxID=13333 RepID=UPI0005D407B3|nr:protein-tyrosine-phosphatase MKP1 [Amborella trichopoda]|eukprot:XP_011626480.1 protein-tyrosine-phosphatase MKP1 [Amborella trichopoda]
MVGEERDGKDHQLPARKTFWRSASWSSSRSTPPCPLSLDPNVRRSHSNNNNSNCKGRSLLPPLQPLSISRKCPDEWPKAGSDDLGEWPQPQTPGAPKPSEPNRPAKADFELRRDKLAFFDKECSRVAEHVYLGSDAVAKNREILRQNGITHVLNCVGFVCPEYFRSDLVYKTLWLQDTPSEDITSILYDVFDYFEDVRLQGGRVLVHCCQGVSRSTALVIAYLMWRDGQSFEDAFQFVKAARGVTNPNMGFACQLLQCQKRVHAVPLSPNSVLRMYRMAPHSPYDPLHLVPKMLESPVASALDSRGAFIVHVPWAIYVWVGCVCDDVMARDAKAAAFQVVRYERARGPIVVIEEGEEPAEFWDALLRGPVLADDSDLRPTVGEGVALSSQREHVEMVKKFPMGAKKVDSYDVDFEIFRRALTGGFVPPFPLSGNGSETRLPERENGWGKLRRKFVSGNVKELGYGSRMSRSLDIDSCKEEDEQSLSVDPLSLASPPYLSPSSFSTDSSSSLKADSSKSPSPSESSRSSTVSPASSNWSDYSFLSSQSSPTISGLVEPLASRHPPKPIAKSASLPPSKGNLLSLAARRGSLSPPLILPQLIDESSRCLFRAERSLSLSSFEEDMPNRSCQFDFKGFDNSRRRDWDLGAKELGSNGDQVVGLTHQKEFSLNLTTPILLRWPAIEKVERFDMGLLESMMVFLLLVPNVQSGELKPELLYVWVGRDIGNVKEEFHSTSDWSSCHEGEINWKEVGCSFITQMGFPREIPVQVVRQAEEPEEFLNHLKSLASSSS